MNTLLHYTSLVLILVSLSCTQLFSQTGTVRGTISDKETGELLMFTNVLVKGTDPPLGAQTDLDGNYELVIEAGTYDLEVTYVGYAINTITGVEVIADDITVIDFLMEEESTELDLGIVVKAEQLDRTENALLTIQRKALTVQDGISAQEISRYGSSNAAESMKRVTGASVIGGKYIYVRGLGDRYSSAQLNGQVLPSNDPYRNSSQLDLIPANLLDNLIATKSFTPDQPGNFTGGNVNIKTKTFPERFTLSASISTSFNTIGSLNDSFLTYEGGDTDWLGFDDGTRDIPSLFNNPKIDSIFQESQSRVRNAVRNDSAFAQVFDEAAESLNREKSPITKTSALDHAVSFSVGNQVSVGNNPLGFLVGLNYRRNFRAYENAELNFFQLAGDSINQTLTTVYDLAEDYGSEGATIGALFNLAYKFGGANKISFNFLYNNDSEKTARFIIGAFPDKISGNQTFVSRALYWNQRQFLSYQLLGEHVFGTSQVKLEWGGSFVNSKQDEPDFTIFQNTFFVRDSEPFDTVYDISVAEFDLPFHFYRDLEDEQVLGKMDLTIPFLQGDSKANKIKLGFQYYDKERTFNNIQYDFVQGRDGEDYAGDDETFFSEENVGIVDSMPPDIAWYPTYDQNRDNKNAYTGTEAIAAGYIMGTYDIGKFRIIAGARVENTDIQVASRDTSFNIGDINATDILPSLNLVYRLNDDMNIRVAATQTVARPNMRELAPFSSFDRGTDFRVIGDTELKRTNIQNYDLRWEWFTRPGELIAVSGYYKNFNNPIVKAFDIRSTNRLIRFANVDEAVVYGVEFEFRKKLDFIADALKDVRFIFNASIIESEVDIPSDSLNNELADVMARNPGKGTTRPFQGQSPFLVNFALNYLNPDKAIDALLSFNVFGERLTLNNRGADPDFFEQPIPQLDFSFKKTFNDRYGIKFSVQNILNANYREEIGVADLTRTIREYERGVTFGLKLSYIIR